MVMYDQALNRAAQRYAAEEPIRAAQALSEDGFGEFKFGMTLKEFSRKLRHPPTVSEAGIGQREAVITSSEDSETRPLPAQRPDAPPSFRISSSASNWISTFTRRRYMKGS